MKPHIMNVIQQKQRIAHGSHQHHHLSVLEKPLHKCAYAHMHAHAQPHVRTRAHTQAHAHMYIYNARESAVMHHSCITDGRRRSEGTPAITTTQQRPPLPRAQQHPMQKHRGLQTSRRQEVVRGPLQSQQQQPLPLPGDTAAPDAEAQRRPVLESSGIIYEALAAAAALMASGSDLQATSITWSSLAHSSCSIVS